MPTVGLVLPNPTVGGISPGAQVLLGKKTSSSSSSSSSSETPSPAAQSREGGVLGSASGEVSLESREKGSVALPPPSPTITFTLSPVKPSSSVHLSTSTAATAATSSTTTTTTTYTSSSTFCATTLRSNSSRSSRDNGEGVESQVPSSPSSVLPSSDPMDTKNSSSSSSSSSSESVLATETEEVAAPPTLATHLASPGSFADAIDNLLSAGPDEPPLDLSPIFPLPPRLEALV